MSQDEKEMIRQLVREYHGSISPWYFFHQLWTDAVGKPNYAKRDWLELEAELFPAGKEVAK